MKVATFAVGDDFDPERVTLVPCDPRDGPVAAHRVAAGSAIETVYALLPLCSVRELARLKVYDFAAFQRKAAAEEQAQAALARETAETVEAS